MGNPGYTVSPAVVVTYPLQEDPVYLYHGPSIHSDAIEDAVEGQIQALSKKLNALQGKYIFGKNACEMCLVSNVRVPAKFKVPEFKKYKGSTCPQTHLVMYCRKMASYVDDGKLLIHYFQDYLSGALLRWYMSLERANIQNLLDIVNVFVQHYKYNLNMAPDHTQLGNMSQKESESFKEYTQRWREVVAQVTPPVEEKELRKLILRTLDSFYYNKLISSMPRDFTEMVGVGVKLEEGVKEGRIARDNSASANRTNKFGGWRKKKGDANAVSHHRPSNRRQQHKPTTQEVLAPQVQQPMSGYYQQPLVAVVAPGAPMMSNLP
ncbi:uncharacterized protein LOC127104043 [Lathyrus oleraceus]|uniref:uncharacterized protein LOC127104043 n=1 Tax=Pisum sativum TaxID=3888 RepID=UPI0021CE7C22|nr:uncharacterized protein LOC127104043 [Pisum sativum]